jgi:hypothetical protein
MTFEVFTAVEMSMLDFWIITLRGLVDRYQGFSGTGCLDLYPLKMQAVSPFETSVYTYKSICVTAVTVRGQYRTRRPKHCDHFLVYCAFLIVSSNDS